MDNVHCGNCAIGCRQQIALRKTASINQIAAIVCTSKSITICGKADNVDTCTCIIVVELKEFCQQVLLSHIEQQCIIAIHKLQARNTVCSDTSSVSCYKNKITNNPTRSKVIPILCCTRNDL